MFVATRRLRDSKSNGAAQRRRAGILQTYDTKAQQAFTAAFQGINAANENDVPAQSNDGDRGMVVSTARGHVNRE
jgi:hypothetical protein